uniref:DRIM domain-containing protein n=1 Tax=Panagrellus redivivus TaxID=6233 RepID=A0A7E4W1T9_PANRE
MNPSDAVVLAIIDLILRNYPNKPSRAEIVSAIREVDPKTSALKCKAYFYMTVKEYHLFTPLDEQLLETYGKMIWALFFLTMEVTEQKSRLYLRVCRAMAEQVLRLRNKKREYLKLLADQTTSNKLATILEAAETPDNA